MIVDIYGQTLLHFAVANNHYEAAEQLMEKMSEDEISMSNHENKYTALHIAAQNGFNEIMELLLKKGQHLLAAKVDSFGQTALHWAAHQGNTLACKILCGYMNPSTINLMTFKGETARDFAITKGFSDIVSLLA